jgi:hypothetical protein
LTRHRPPSRPEGGHGGAGEQRGKRNYAPVKAETQPINVSEPVAMANRAISPAADMDLPRRAARPDRPCRARRVEAQESVLRDPIGKFALKEARSYLAAPNLTASNVGQVFRAKTNIDQMIAKATENGQGALVGELMPIRSALDHALARTSKNYAGARDAYKLAQQRIEAIDLGKTLGSKPVGRKTPSANLANWRRRSAGRLPGWICRSADFTGPERGVRHEQGEAVHLGRDGAGV